MDLFSKIIFRTLLAYSPVEYLSTHEIHVNRKENISFVITTSLKHLINYINDVF